MNEILEYLRNTIGLDVRMLEGGNIPTAQLPFYLKQRNELFEVIVGENRLLFVKPKHKEHPAPDQIKKQMDQLYRILQIPPVYVFEKVDTYTRKRLVKNKTAFVIKNKQMYVPFMMIDLEEIKVNDEEKQYLSPAAQCILIYHLMVSSLNDQNLKSIAKLLTYSEMTISRAIKELEEFEVCEGGRTNEKRVRFTKEGRDLWNVIKYRLKSPVKKTIWLQETPDIEDLVISGFSALSMYTNLSNGNQRTFAVNTNLYRQLKRDNFLIGEDKKYGYVALEVWKYDPKILEQKGNVDPLSLFLCLQDEEDERVEQAVEQLIDELW